MKYKLFGQVFEKVDNGITIDGKFFETEYLERLYQEKYKKINIIYRPSGMLFYQAVYKHNFPLENFKIIGE